MTADWSRVDAQIELTAALARKELERMTDDALVSIGHSKQYVNRRRGQLRRWANKREA